jgi:DNA-binding CsgD family transcriptional regulator
VLNTGPLTAAEKQEIADRLARGEGQTAIATALNRARGTVQHEIARIRAAGSGPLNTGRLTAAEKQEIAARFARGEGQQAIATALNRTPATVQNEIARIRKARPARPKADAPASSGAGPSGAPSDLSGGSGILQLDSLAEAVGRSWNAGDMFEIPGAEAARHFGLPAGDQEWVRFRVNGDRPVGGGPFLQGDLTYILLGG